MHPRIFALRRRLMRKLGSVRSRRKRSTDAVATSLAVLLTSSGGVSQLFTVVGDAIPASLTGAAADPARGRAIVVDRRLSACLLCHTGPFAEEKFDGTLAPDLAGAG